jgi:hypothetical protein
MKEPGRNTSVSWVFGLVSVRMFSAEELKLIKKKRNEKGSSDFFIWQGLGQIYQKLYH